jgi:hypothetical protein
LPRRRRLGHHPERHTLEHGEKSNGQPGIRAEIVAYRAQDCHVPVDDHLGELLERRDDLAELPIVVHGDRHADFRRGDDIHRRPVGFEDLEQPAQEAVRHEHPRRGDFDDGHPALARQRGDRPIRRR